MTDGLTRMQSAATGSRGLQIPAEMKSHKLFEAPGSYRSGVRLQHMRLSLVVLSPGKMEGKSILVSGSKFLIGRDPQCQLRPSSPVVSNRHCALLIREGSVYVQDLMSTNGTLVNGKKIEREVELRDQDQLTVGALKLGIRIECPQPAPIQAPHKVPASAEDEAASLLLALADDDSGTVKSEAATESDIAAGSTVLGIPSPAIPSAAASGDEKEGPTKLEQAKQAQADTSSAAAAILSKYMRRR